MSDIKKDTQFTEKQKEKLRKQLKEYWSDINLITPTWKDDKTPYYETEPYVQNFSED